MSGREALTASTTRAPKTVLPDAKHVSQISIGSTRTWRSSEAHDIALPFFALRRQ